MKILNKAEQEAFDKPPTFNSAERKLFFSFSVGQLAMANRLTNSNQKIVFLLSCGYFKATKKFFSLSTFHKHDVYHVMHKINTTFNELEHIPEASQRRYRKLILDYYGFHPFDQDARSKITKEALEMVCKNQKPKSVFWRCVDMLVQMRIVLPSYYQLSELILKVLNRRKKELICIVDQHLNHETRSVLDGLFRQEPSLKNDTSNPQYARYKLTLLKKPSHSTKPTKVKDRVADLVYLQELYGYVQDILPRLKLGHEGIRYYAKSVIKSDIFQLNQRAREDRYIHVIAFIAHQYYRLQDNLVDVLLSVMQSFRNSTTREYRDWCFEHREDQDVPIKSLLNIIDEGLLKTLSCIQTVLETPEMSNADKILAIQSLVGKNQDIVNRAKEIKASIESVKKEDIYLKILKEKSIRLQNRISPIIKALNLEEDMAPSQLMEAIAYFKEKDGVITRQAPQGFLEKDQVALHASVYKVYLFMHTASALKSGTLNLKHSHKYRPMDDYLISKDRWKNDKHAFIERANLQTLINPIELLKQLEGDLTQGYQMTNASYLENKNPYLKIEPNGAFTIATPKQEEEFENKDLRPFFPEQHVPLCEVLATVNKHSEFLKEFQHWQQRHTHSNNATDRTIYAGIIGNGCAIGAQKIAQISKQINANNLDHVINWYFSLENIQAANDRILKLLSKMALPNIYRRSQHTIHTSSDGQKSDVQTDSLNANYSFKYFGKDQGVSIYTFVDERHFLWHSLVFSASERESAYVIDGLMRNDVVKSDIHSTDSHGYSEAIFAVTYLLGFSYAPRIKNLKKQSLYIFKSHPKQERFNWKIKPDKYVNEVIIRETWDDILRLICTIKLKETTASEIFRRLNSYSKQHKLYQGLKAFGQIIKSKFILNYLDDIEFRQSIEKQLNKIELANRFTKAVAVGDPRGFYQSEREDQEIAESCNRLIKNSIICWNYLYLSDKLEKDTEQKKVLLTAISRHSVMSWAHINMLGEYDFSDEKLADSFNIRPPKLHA